MQWHISMPLVCKENKGNVISLAKRADAPKKKIAPGDHSDAIRESMVDNTTLWHEVNPNLMLF